MSWTRVTKKPLKLSIFVKLVSLECGLKFPKNKRMWKYTWNFFWEDQWFSLKSNVTVFGKFHHSFKWNLKIINKYIKVKVCEGLWLGNTVLCFPAQYKPALCRVLHPKYVCIQLNIYNNVYGP